MRFLPTIDAPVWPCDESEYVAGRRYPWTPREVQVIRERYLAEGLAACRALLPARSVGVIMAKAAKLGLKRQKAHKAPKTSNEILDAAIRRLYQATPSVGAHRDFCQRHGVTRQWVYRRAIALGVTVRMRKPGPWSGAEDAILEANACKCPEQISRELAKRGFSRTPSACADQRYRLGIGALRDRDPDHYSANDLARVMGVDTHVVLRWIERCGLVATLDESHGARGVWRIHRAHLRAWLIRSAEWDHRKCRREWLVEILSGPPVPVRGAKRGAA